MANEQQDQILERNVETLLTHAHEPPRMDAASRDRVLEGIRAARRSPPTSAPPIELAKRRPGIMPGVLALAAVLALLWAGAFFGGRGIGSAEGEIYANEAVAPLRVELADGSHALLRGGSKIEQVAHREIRLLEGELLLDVVEHAEPFIVHTAHGRAVALGTRFSLRAEAARVLTAVVRGTVRLERGDERAVLRAGETGALNEGASPEKTLGQRLTHTLAWARDALSTLDEGPSEPVRRGNLVARDPRWQGEWPLPIRKLTVDIHVEDGVARTTIDQTFFNHVNRQLEGVYSFPLPSDAAISRLAMYVDGKLMEGGIVERQRGRDVYENIVYQRRDPALLEWMKGNEFRVRVFPLPPRTEKRVILSYTQPLQATYGAYRLQVPIPEIDLPVGEVEYRVDAGTDAYEISSDSHALVPSGPGQASYSARQATIGDDLLITLQEHEPVAAHGRVFEDEGGDYLMVRAHPTFTAPIRHQARSWVALYDTSASRDPQELEAQALLLRRFLREMDEDDRVAVMAFDTETRTMPGGFSRVRDVDPSTLEDFLAAQSRVAAGVTNLSLGLDAALGLLAGEENAPHVLYLGDGSVTEGSTELEALRRRVRDRATFVGISVGDEVDAHVLDTLAQASGGLALELSPGEDLGWRAFEVIATLNSPRIVGASATLLDDSGQPLDDVEPLASTHSIPHGECVVVLARGSGLSDGRVGSVRLEGTLAGESWSQVLELPDPAPGARYLPRLWAQARIDARLADDADAHREEITKLGLEHFLITPFTSLLVLENEQMYTQFDVKRPDADGWAHYPAPPEIEVVHESVGSDPFALEPTGDQLILRDPIELLQWPSLRTNWANGAEGTIGLGGLGLIGAGRGGGGVGFGTIGLGNVRGHGGGGGLSGWITDDLDQPDLTTREAEVAGSEEMQRRQLDFKRAEGPRVTAAMGKTGKSASRRRAPRTRSLAHQDGANFWSVSGRWSRGAGLYAAGTTGIPYPIALHYASDPRLDDLTGFVPAMFGDAYDHARESMLASAADREPGRISPAARELVDAARRSLVPASYGLPEGGRLGVDGSGRIRLERTSTEGLAERVVYDGENTLALYDELGIAVRRRIGPTSPLLLATWAPWIMPPADDLARWYDVELAGPRTLKLINPKGDADAIEIELDDENRVVVLRRGDQATRFEHGSGSLTIVRGEDRTELKIGPAPDRIDPVDTASWTVVELPLRRPAHWESVIQGAEPGSAPWRHAQRQRMAAAAALGDTQRIATAARELAAEVETLSPGELTLASGGVSAMNREVLEAVLSKRGDATQIADYLRAAHTQRRSWSARPHDRLAKRGTEGLLGTLATYRAALGRIDYGRAHTQVSRIERFVAARGDSTLAFILVQRAAQYMAWNRSKQAVGLWRDLAEHPKWKVPALHSAATISNQRGNYAEAAEMFEEAFETALASGEPPIVDWPLRQALQAGRGQASFELLWSRWRASVLSSKGLEQRIAFTAAAHQLGEMDDIHRVVATTKAKDLEDLGLAVSLIDQLLAANLLGDAWTITRRVLSEAPDDPSVLDRAATVSELQGRTGDAAAYLERAMQAEIGEAVSLDGLRSDYRRLVGLHTRLSQSQMSESQADVHRDHALRVAAQWRREDPDNAEIDHLCAGLYPDDPDRAWRHLSSIIERHPAQGSAYADVAGALEREGRLRRADTIWERATRVEPTDPTWQLRRAENLAAVGQDAKAKALLDAVVEGKWQDRFVNTVWQAKNLRKQLGGE